MPKLQENDIRNICMGSASLATSLSWRLDASLGFQLYLVLDRSKLRSDAVKKLRRLRNGECSGLNFPMLSQPKKKLPPKILSQVSLAQRSGRTARWCFRPQKIASHQRCCEDFFECALCQEFSSIPRQRPLAYHSLGVKAQQKMKVPKTTMWRLVKKTIQRRISRLLGGKYGLSWYTSCFHCPPSLSSSSATNPSTLSVQHRHSGHGQRRHIRSRYRVHKTYTYHLYIYTCIYIHIIYIYIVIKMYV